MVMLFLVTIDFLWWGNRTAHLLRIVGGDVLAVAFGHLVPTLWLWFSVIPAVLAAPPLLSAWWAWRGPSGWSWPLAAASSLITYAFTRWGEGFFPLVAGPGGYYFRGFPFGTS